MHTGSAQSSLSESRTPCLAFCLEGWPAWTMGKDSSFGSAWLNQGVCPRETSGQEATKVWYYFHVPSFPVPPAEAPAPATLPWVLITSAPCPLQGKERGCHYFLCDDRTHDSLPVVLSRAHGFTNHTFIKLSTILQFTCLSDPSWGLWWNNFNYLFVCVPV